MIQQLNSIGAEAAAKIEACSSLESLDSLRSSLFGRKGELTQLLKQLGSLPADERRDVGRLANQMKSSLESAIAERRAALEEEGSAAETFDLTLPSVSPRRCGLHPVTQVEYALNDAFNTLGFEVYDGPEISSELYAFDHLNFPPDHPARESMDTYWLAGCETASGAERLCLRPHLTGASVRYMETHEPPFRFVYPGRVYRNEVTDARHERAFRQYEALIVDRDIPFSAGELLVRTVLDTIFGRPVDIRMRAGFFPFVEPGFEIDMRCLVCGGPGCSVCKHVGWIEVMPGGPPHPNVLRAGGIDPTKWSGFYLNLGLDRLVMMRTGIDDVRHFHSGDLRFLSQFN